RSGGKEKGTQWANVINPRVVGTSVIGLDQPITLKAIYNDRDSSAKVTFYLDNDQNPLNDNNALVFGTKALGQATDPTGVTMGAKTSKIKTGEYFLGAKISDSEGHVRYSYGASTIDVERADFSTFADGIVSVAGTSKNDNIVIAKTG